MNVSIYNKQKDLLFSKESIHFVVTAILEHEKIPADEISLYFVDMQAISSLHEKYFHDPSPTDCITFPMDKPDSLEKPLLLGEIFVCPKMAVNYAVEHDADPYTELTLYIVHGILHLLGFKDQKKSDREEMREKEKECMNYLREKKLVLSQN